jgi:uncharacterized protein
MMKRGVTPDQRTALIAEVRAIYAQLETLRVERTCVGRSECCQFARTGATPYLTLGEAIVAREGMRSLGIKKLTAPRDGSCPLLQDGRCRIYASRPFGCRTHFCKPAGGPLPRATVRHWIQQMEDIDRKLGGEGAVNLPRALL